MSRVCSRVVIPAALLALSLAACGDKGDPAKPAAGPSSGSAKPGPAAAPANAGGYGYSANLGDDLDKKVGDSIAKARKYLLSQRDEATGAWDPKGQIPVGFTSIATLALIGSVARTSVSADPTIKKSLEFVASKQKENGSIFSNDRFVNYETSAAISALASARIQQFSAAQGKARDYVVASQIQGDEKDPSYGGFPYVSKSDPTGPVDLSNAQFATAAAHDAEVKDAGFWTRVAKYLGRVQNRSESNDAVVKVKVGDVEKEAVSGNDGGAGYAPGRSKAEYDERADGKVEPRSYGSMTYALLKCLLFAGVKADDPRVKAAVAWLEKNFTVDRNPGFEKTKDAKTGQVDPKKGFQGYYYYFLTMSRALAEYEKATGKEFAVSDASGKPHNWRREVAAKVVSFQKADGSWTNDVDRWEEGSPILVTSYALQTLATCQGRLP